MYKILSDPASCTAAILLLSSCNWIWDKAVQHSCSWWSFINKSNQHLNIRTFQSPCLKNCSSKLQVINNTKDQLWQLYTVTGLLPLLQCHIHSCSYRTVGPISTTHNSIHHNNTQKYTNILSVLVIKSDLIYFYLFLCPSDIWEVDVSLWRDIDLTHILPHTQRRCDILSLWDVLEILEKIVGKLFLWKSDTFLILCLSIKVVCQIVLHSCKMSVHFSCKDNSKLEMGQEFSMDF